MLNAHVGTLGLQGKEAIDGADLLAGRKQDFRVRAPIPGLMAMHGKLIDLTAACDGIGLVGKGVLPKPVPALDAMLSLRLAQRPHYNANSRGRRL
jgi:hypothetical protein